MERSEQPFFSPATHDAVQTKEEKTPFFQTKSSSENGLTIGKPGDPYEKEADAMADAVVHPSAHTPAIQQKKINNIQRASQATPQEEEQLGTAAQRMEKDKEVQTKMEVQRQGEEEDPAELQQQEEEEDPTPAVQAMAENEEEPGIQKMEEEEETAPAVQSKGENEEEPAGIQAKGEEEENPDMQKKEEEEENPEVQTKPDGSAGGKTSPTLSDKIEQSRGNGHPMSDKTRTEMETAFGVDFKEVNLHTDQQAIEMNKGLHAQAFTHGQEIYFNTGKYNPESTSGKYLLAHELTHTIQQMGGTDAVQRTIGDGHDLDSPRFSGNLILEEAFDNERLIKVFTEGDHVVRVQQTLVDLGFSLPLFGVDGKYGNETKAAIKSYQRARGLVDDGIIGPITMTRLDVEFPSTLHDRLNRMLNAATSNGRTVCDAIQAAPQPQRDAVRSDPALMTRLRTALTPEAFARNRKRLGDQPPTGAALLNLPAVQTGLRQAFTDSNVTNATNRHEEGGWIVFNWVDDSISIVRVPSGTRSALPTIVGTRPPDTTTTQVVAWFHTHPNPSGPDPVSGSTFGLGASAGDIGFSNANALPGMVREYAPPGTVVGGPTHDLVFGPAVAGIHPAAGGCDVEQVFVNKKGKVVDAI